MQHKQTSDKPLLLIGAFLFCLCFVHFSPVTTLAAAPPALTDPDRIRYKPLSFHPPIADRIILKNGLVVYLLENGELPLLKIRVVVRTGSIYDPPGKEGLAELTATMMETGGIAGMTGNSVDETLESMAALLQTSINRDYGTFSLSLLKNDLEKGLDIFSRILMQPVFEQDKLTLAKGLKIEELRRILDDPQKLAFREFGRLMYEDPQWGRVATRESISRLQRDDLIRTHELFYNPENVMIAVSGDIGRKEAEILLNRYFGIWKLSEKKVPTPPLPHPREGEIFFLPKDIPQSIVLFGWFAPSKKDDQFYPFEILDFIVGSGGFRSRIFQEIRTNRGLAYSTGSFYKAGKEHGLFVAYALTKSESTVSVFSLIQSIFREIGEKPVLPEELKMARNAIQNSFIFSFTSADQIAFQQLLLKYNDLPDDYLVSYRNKIDNVTADEIRNVAGLYLAQEKAVVLIIGNDAVYRDISTTFYKIKRIEGKYD
ncbi:MAG: insulinase family protein [Proteobacteria bacterium]|nr:insulinase family protein [Pseudomonadota bacterium]